MSLFILKLFLYLFKKLRKNSTVFAVLYRLCIMSVFVDNIIPIQCGNGDKAILISADDIGRATAFGINQCISIATASECNLSLRNAYTVKSAFSVRTCRKCSIHMRKIRLCVYVNIFKVLYCVFLIFVAIINRYLIWENYYTTYIFIVFKLGNKSFVICFGQRIKRILMLPKTYYLYIVQKKLFRRE